MPSAFNSFFGASDEHQEPSSSMYEVPAHEDLHTPADALKLAQDIAAIGTPQQDNILGDEESDLPRDNSIENDSDADTIDDQSMDWSDRWDKQLAHERRVVPMNLRNLREFQAAIKPLVEEKYKAEVEKVEAASKAAEIAAQKYSTAQRQLNSINKSGPEWLAFFNKMPPSPDSVELDLDRILDGRYSRALFGLYGKKGDSTINDPSWIVFIQLLFGHGKKLRDAAAIPKDAQKAILRAMDVLEYPTNQSFEEVLRVARAEHFREPEFAEDELFGEGVTARPYSINNSAEQCMVQSSSSQEQRDGSMADINQDSLESDNDGSQHGEEDNSERASQVDIEPLDSEFELEEPDEQLGEATTGGSAVPKPAEVGSSQGQIGVDSPVLVSQPTPVSASQTMQAGAHTQGPPSAQQVQPPPATISSGGPPPPLPQPAQAGQAIAQPRFRAAHAARHPRPPKNRHMVPALFFPPAAYATNPRGYDAAFREIARTDLTSIRKFHNGTRYGPIATMGELTGDFKKAVMMNTTDGACLNAYITMYHPGTQIFRRHGKDYGRMWTWFIAQISGPNGPFEEARYRKFMMQQIEANLPPHVAARVTQWKQTVAAPNGPPLDIWNPPSAPPVPQNVIVQATGVGVNGPAHPGVQTLGGMGPPQGGGQNSSIGNGAVAGPNGGTNSGYAFGPNPGIGGGNNGTNHTSNSGSRPSAASSGNTHHPGTKRPRPEPVIEDDEEEVFDSQDMSAASPARKKTRHSSSSTNAGIQHPLPPPPPPPPSRDDGFSSSKKRPHEVIEVEDDADSPDAPRRPIKKLRHFGAETIKVEVQDRPAEDMRTYPTISSLQENYERLISPLQGREMGQTQRQPQMERSMTREASQNPNSRSLDGRDNTTNSRMAYTDRSHEIQQTHIQDFDDGDQSTAQAPEEAFLSYPNPTRFEHGQFAQSSHPYGYSYPAPNRAINRAGTNVNPREVDYFASSEGHHTPGGMTQGHPMNDGSQYVDYPSSV